jgi:hypothetical protein
VFIDRIGAGVTNLVSERVGNLWFHVESAVVYNSDWVDRVPGSLNSQSHHENKLTPPLYIDFRNYDTMSSVYRPNWGWDYESGLRTGAPYSYTPELAHEDRSGRVDRVHGSLNSQLGV